MSRVVQTLFDGRLDAEKSILEVAYTVNIRRLTKTREFDTV